MDTKTKGTKEWSDHSFNFSKGCSWGCKYCYACGIALRFNQISSPDEWLLMENKPKPSFNPKRKYEGIIMTPTSHDITLDNVDLAKKFYKQLLMAGNQLLIVSKPLKKAIIELADHLEEYKDTNQITWRFSITTLMPDNQKLFEPKAPGSKHRIEVLKEMFDRGWNTSVSIEPFLDATLLSVINIVHPYVRENIWVGLMNKKYCPRDLWEKAHLTRLYEPKMLQYFKEVIDLTYPDKIMLKDNFVNNLPKSKQNTLLVYGSGGKLPPELENPEKKSWKNDFK